MKINRKEINFKCKGGITDAFDDVLKSAFNITDEEFDDICENATDNELNIMLDGLDNSSFKERRKSLEIRNKYVKYFNK